MGLIKWLKKFSDKNYMYNLAEHLHYNASNWDVLTELIIIPVFFIMRKLPKNSYLIRDEFKKCESIIFTYYILITKLRLLDNNNSPNFDSVQGIFFDEVVTLSEKVLHIPPETILDMFKDRIDYYNQRYQKQKNLDEELNLNAILPAFQHLLLNGSTSELFFHCESIDTFVLDDVTSILQCRIDIDAYYSAFPSLFDDQLKRIKDTWL